MREIKFRAWNIVHNLIYYKEEGQSNASFFNNCPESIYKLMQFTGLKDKNGKEIYEGDVLTWLADDINKKAIVIWKDCGWCAKRIDKKFNEFEKYIQFSDFIPVEISEDGKDDLFDGEVIGNIYENPELLKEVGI